MQTQIEYHPFSALRLDPTNPRLPEEMIGANTDELLQLFYREYDLDELAKSYMENGFFTSEALIVNRKDNVVLEGNRRLAALKYLHHDEDAKNAEIPTFMHDAPAFDAHLEKLVNIPIIYVDDRESLAPYLGFRHINGPKQWLPSAKARYVWQRVRNWIARNPNSTDDPFYTIGREIGSNSAGVRNQYLQYAILREAQISFNLGPQVSYVLSKRYGVWSRLNNNLAILDHIGFPRESRSTVDSIDRATKDIDEKRLRGILEDLTPEYASDGSVRRKAVVTDSRQVAVYAEIIASEDALEYLREHRDFKTAAAIAQGLKVNTLLQNVIESMKTVRDTVVEPREADERTLDLTKRLTILVQQVKLSVELALNQHN